ncbi:PAS domain-containing protein [Bradyrhizobium diazoefficiens]|uniref:PAS-domain containing protein n=1 Tax=Bradyrhizobium TaxID=374 RepID=UPI000765963E|nr:PAS-domain containing protein [Bradyrhizobium diazoefficiens]MBP1095765.1 PAS domain-containing protein [Bradyrhizobium japonicum]MBR0863209.1 PAS-domain containing protein [Bradyrhizobium diazoefficiens]MBR0887773.1 PAS-domain containing protein [Bradyrhizobium diazoefficiens]MBR0919603.1 PAS-domain containing protein [Bradyrhizobium diazoefficiens]WLA64183.1 PAS-domain containing protein [Bradyrhizobium diazoefficiens]
MRYGWRAICGPVLTAATLLLAILFDRAIPSPAPLLVCIVALAGALSGFASAITSAAFAVTGTVLLLFFHRAMPLATADLVQLGLLAVTTAGTAAISGLMRERLLGTFAAERQSHATAARLSAALDQVDIGIVLLDAETRAEFINRAFRDYFAVPDDIADGKPPFVALMYHGRDTGAFELPEDELATFIAQRMEMVRIGDATPINIALRSGEVLRFVCAALPDGGRMLSYTPVTDLVRHTDAPSRADYYRSLRDPTGRRLIRYLRAAE